MKIRAKMYCTSVSKAGDSENVILHPVCDEQNKTWAAATPCGSVQMTISNPFAQGKFNIGDTYFVDFTPAAAAEKDET